MGRGNIFMGYVQGKIGGTVFSVSHGKQLERAYNPNKYDPRTNPQILKRAKWANASLFYSRSSKAQFKFAYQDLRKNESPQNAFMRTNALKAFRTIPANINDFYYPSIGIYTMSHGSVRPIQFCWANGKFRSTQVRYTPANPNMETLSELSEFLITQGYLEGDIITITLIKTDARLGNVSQPIIPGTYQPEYSTIQFRIDTQSQIELEQLGLFGVSSSANRFIWGLNDTFNTEDYIGAGVIQVSRQWKDKIHVSDADLVLDETALAALSYSMTNTWRDIVLQAWGATGDAILNGTQSANKTDKTDIFFQYGFTLPATNQDLNNKTLVLSQFVNPEDIAQHLLLYDSSGLPLQIKVGLSRTCQLKDWAGNDVGSLSWISGNTPTWKFTMNEFAPTIAGIIWQ